MGRLGPTLMLGHRIWGNASNRRDGAHRPSHRTPGARIGLSIHYHNRRRVHEEIETELEATYWESLDQMLAHMDIISVNVPIRRQPSILSLSGA